MQDCFNGDPLGQFITYESSEINTIVETESRYKMKQRNCITFSLDIGSYIRFSPNEDKGNEIILVFVSNCMRRQSMGELITISFFMFLF